MSEVEKMVMIYSTFPDTATAKDVGGKLVDHGLAACVNIIPQMTSIYRWEGALTTNSEAIMLIKTRAALAAKVIAAVEVEHPYDTPALLVFEVTHGAQGYLDWLASQTQA